MAGVLLQKDIRVFIITGVPEVTVETLSALTPSNCIQIPIISDSIQVREDSSTQSRQVQSSMNTTQFVSDRALFYNGIGTLNFSTYLSIDNNNRCTDHSLLCKLTGLVEEETFYQDVTSSNYQLVRVQHYNSTFCVLISYGDQYTILSNCNIASLSSTYDIANFVVNSWSINYLNKYDVDAKVISSSTGTTVTFTGQIGQASIADQQVYLIPKKTVIAIIDKETEQETIFGFTSLDVQLTNAMAYVDVPILMSKHVSKVLTSCGDFDISGSVQLYVRPNSAQSQLISTIAEDNTLKYILELRTYNNDDLLSVFRIDNMLLEYSYTLANAIQANISFINTNATVDTTALKFYS